MAKNEFAPCKLVEDDDGSFQLIFNDIDPTAEIFEELDQEGGGYGWHGVVDALVRMKAPRLATKVKYDREASMFVALSKDRNVLKEVAERIRSARMAPKLLREAIEKADPDLMD